VDETARTLLTVGALLLSGLAADFLGRRIRLPRVTLLLLLGVAVGPAGLDLIPDDRERWFPVLADVALVMIGFLLGAEFTLASLRERGRLVLVISLVQSVVTAVAVGAGLLALGAGRTEALLLAGIATATAPAATVAVLREVGARGPFSKTLLGVVALDDVWGIVAFSLLAATAGVLAGGDGATAIAEGAWEIGGAVALGAALGVPMALLSGRVRPGEPSLEEAMGIVLLCAGLALWLDVSSLLAAVVLGAIVANLATHHTRPIHEIENLEQPFLVLFFLLAGASLETEAIRDLGIVGVGYLALRTAGKLGGAWLGGRVAGAPARTSRLLGLALLPQAGVALGMALAAAERFPDDAERLLSVVIAATIVFEVGGSVLTRLAVVAAGEGGAESESAAEFVGEE
jgi:Kef-type K+ transport system membrane component KefB